MSYDGRWYQRLGEVQQGGLVDGFLDAARSHGRAAEHVIASRSELEQVYAQDPALLGQPLAQVLGSRGRPAGPATPGGEHYAGRHGFFDGDYWYQMSPEGRVGYVLGYTLERGQAGPEWMQQASTQAGAVTHWYGFDSADGVSPPGHPASTAIGEVLGRIDARLR